MTITRSPTTGFITDTTLGSVTTLLGHSGFGELDSTDASAGATALYSTSYTRDALGRITQLDETVEGVASTWVYEYDVAGRLWKVTDDGVLVGQYSYDNNGNRTGVTNDLGLAVRGSYDAQDRLLSYGDATYTHTANGELSSRTTPTGTTSYVYDVLGNLVQVTLEDSTVIEYVVDGENRRVGRKVGGTLVQGFLYKDRLNPVAELDGTGNVVARFVYGTKANVPNYMEKGGVTYRILSDHLGSVRLVVDTSTGVVAQRLDYDEYGVVLMDSAPGFQPLGFAGGIYDHQTKLVRFGARDYDAEVGRWTSKDPILFDGVDGTNLYGYVVNDPMNGLDPEGQQTAGSLAGWICGTSPLCHLALAVVLHGGGGLSHGMEKICAKAKEPDPGECVLQGEENDPYRGTGICVFSCKESNGREFEWRESALLLGGKCPDKGMIKNIVKSWPKGPLGPPK